MRWLWKYWDIDVADILSAGLTPDTALEDRPIRLALYFPLFAASRQWDFRPADPDANQG